jgi:hypothetical protein
VVVVVDFMLEGSGIYLCWTGDRVLGVCAALCVFRTVAMVERGHFLVHLLEAHQHGEEREEYDQERQDAKALRQMEIVACLESVMNMNMLEVGVVSLLSCLSS